MRAHFWNPSHFTATGKIRSNVQIMFLQKSKLTNYTLRPRWLHCFPLIIACICVVSASKIAADASGISVQVDPDTGDDSSCNTTLVCKSIARAVQVGGASQVSLSSGIFNESTVIINNIASLVVFGVPSSTFFDCSHRLQQSTGAAFSIINSNVTFVGIIFQHCSNSNSSGGAVTAVYSNVTVSQCSFFNCSAANGGALSATGHGGDLYLDVKNSSFSHNAAIGGLIGCPTGELSSEPCSTWGGAVAAFEMPRVSITGCTMAENNAVAIVPLESQQNASSRNAVAGGGCVSVLFRGNSSASTMLISDNLFQRCNVDVSNSSTNNIIVGNGIVCCRESVCLCSYSHCSSLTNMQDTAAQYPCTLVCRPD
jgi:hypothetical protein